ncbi:MAG: metal ABC transporter substrate-binding protein [Candidatus Saccharicenans sp.]
MKNRLKKAFFILFLPILIFLPGFGQAETVKKINIVTTIFPLTDMAAAVGGDRAQVNQIIPPSVDIHNFQLRPEDLKILSGADLLLAVGSQLETWLNKVEKSLGQANFISLRFYDFLKSIGYPGLRTDDPHLWLDFEADRLLVDKITETLSKIDPEGKETYRQNGQTLKNELQFLDDKYRQTLSGCRQKYLIIAGHQAFGYLASRYGLILESLTGANPEAQPGPRKLQEIVNLIKSERIKAIFVESSTSPAYAEAIGRETGVKLYPLSTGVNLNKMEIKQKLSFLELMNNNLETLKKGLGCE